MNIKDFFMRNRAFSIIFLIVVLVRIVLFFDYHELWWDGGVYIGMGKFLFSLGKAGLWEHIRPVLWPLILGTGWKSGFNTILFGRILTFLLSIASVLIFYLITLRIFNKKTALIAAALFSFSTIFFYLGFHLYTEIPALFFVLLGFYFFIEQRHYFSGLFFGLGFLTKFPAPVFFIAAVMVLLYKREINGFFFACLGFATPVIPSLIINQIFYGGFLMPLLDAREAIVNVVGCNVLRYKPWYHYFYLILFDNPLNIFSVLGIFYFVKKYKEKRLLALLCVVLPLIYFSQLHCRDYRYLTLFIPFVIMFSANGISSLIKKKKYFIPALFAVLAFSLAFSVNFYFSNELDENFAATGYFKFLKGEYIGAEIWSSNPVISAYSDLKINKIYYPIYDEGVSASFYEYLTTHEQRIGYVFLDNCGGGIICRPEDKICAENLNATFSYLKENFEIVYNKTSGRCFYRIYKK